MKYAPGYPRILAYIESYTLKLKDYDKEESRSS